MTRRTERTKGFTLVEVLVAFTLLVLVLSASLPAMTVALDQERIADVRGARVLAARSVLERVGAEIPVASGVTVGRLATDEAWELEISALAGAGADPVPGLRPHVIRLTVRPERGPPLVLETVRLGGALP